MFAVNLTFCLVFAFDKHALRNMLYSAADTVVEGSSFAEGVVLTTQNTCIYNTYLASTITTCTEACLTFALTSSLVALATA